MFDQYLTRVGHSRDKVLVTTQLMAALDTIHNSDCLMISSLQELEVPGGCYEISQKPLAESLQIDPFFPLNLVQHRRAQQSNVH